MILTRSYFDSILTRSMTELERQVALLFSANGKRYSQYRPTYPNDLFEFLSSIVHTHDVAWDCGTGNGQTAVSVANHFTKVFASDVSADQIAHAVRRDNVDYRVASAECSGLPDASVDLITVSQAFH